MLFSRLMDSGKLCVWY